MAAVGDPLTLARGKLALHWFFSLFYCVQNINNNFVIILTDVKRAVELLEKLQKSESFSRFKFAVTVRLIR
jgi:hypothetical protein